MRSGPVVAASPGVRGEATPEHLSPDTDAGSVTDVDRGFVASVTPFEVGQLVDTLGEISDRVLTRVTNALAHAPTPRVDVSTGLVRERASTAGRVLGGRYRLGRQLGAGGYGAVFAAEDTITGERVAIKVLAPATTRNQELIIRFHREAIAASRVRHPHIVTVIDFDIDDDDEHFIVMEHLDGRDLAQTLATTGRLEPVRALTIAAQCARGLAAAHRVGVLHRDLKPGNVFLVRRGDGSEIVKVIDFGISKLTPIAGDYTDVTSGSKVVGTPSYMSPEQARGAVLDARTDVYALGVMLFEMLVGERPFTGRSPIEIIGNHISAPRVAPSSARHELASCPGLDTVVLRALSSVAGDRFPSMEVFGEAIIECLRAIAPDAAEHATEPTGERTGRARWKQDDRATSPIERRGNRARWYAVAALVGAVSIAGTLAASITRDPRRDVPALAPPPLASTPVPSAPPVPSVAAVIEPPSTSFTVRITSTPSGASVYRGASRVGSTPLELTFDVTETAPTVAVGAPGYRTRRVAVSAEHDHVDVELSVIRQPKSRPRPAPTTTRGVGEW